MKRRLVSALVFVCAASVSAFDYGATIDETLLFAPSAQADLTNALKTTLWMYAGRPAGTLLTVRLSYINQAYGPAEQTIPTVSFPFMFDVDELSFGFNYPAGRIVLGRYVLTEPTGAIFSHKVDGASLRYKIPAMTFGMDVGYTGLLWKNASSIAPSLMDIHYARSDDVVLGSPRLLGVFFVQPPPLFGQELRIGAIAQEDLRNPDAVTAEGESEKRPGMAGLLDTQYLFLHARGPLLPTLYYTAFVVYGAGRSLSYIDNEYRYSDISSVLAGASAQLYLREISFSLIRLRFQYGSGDGDASSFWESNTEGRLRTFISLTGSPSGVVFSPNPGNTVLGELSYSIRPAPASKIELLRTLQVVTAAVVFFRPTTGYISEVGIPAGATDRYLGAEADIQVNSRPFSDLGVSLAGGVFFPSNAFVTDSGGREDPRFTLKVTMSLSL